MQDTFDDGPPLFPVTTLAGDHNEEDRDVERGEDADGLGGVGGEIPGEKEIWEWGDENREMEYEERVGEIGDDISRELCTFVVVGGEESAAEVETAAFFTGVDEGEI